MNWTLRAIKAKFAVRIPANVITRSAERDQGESRSGATLARVV